MHISCVHLYLVVNTKLLVLSLCCTRCFPFCFYSPIQMSIFQKFLRILLRQHFQLPVQCLKLLTAENAQRGIWLIYSSANIHWFLMLWLTVLLSTDWQTYHTHLYCSRSWRMSTLAPFCRAFCVLSISSLWAFLIASMAGKITNNI